MRKKYSCIGSLLDNVVVRTWSSRTVLSFTRHLEMVTFLNNTSVCFRDPFFYSSTRHSTSCWQRVDNPCFNEFEYGLLTRDTLDKKKLGVNVTIAPGTFSAAFPSISVYLSPFLVIFLPCTLSTTTTSLFYKPRPLMVRVRATVAVRLSRADDCVHADGYVPSRRLRLQKLSVRLVRARSNDVYAGESFRTHFVNRVIYSNHGGGFALRHTLCLQRQKQWSSHFFYISRIMHTRLRSTQCLEIMCMESRHCREAKADVKQSLRETKNGGVLERKAVAQLQWKNTAVTLSPCTILKRQVKNVCL